MKFAFRRVKLLRSEIGLTSCEIAFGSLGGEFYFTFGSAEYFTICDSKLYHIERKRDISLVGLLSINHKNPLDGSLRGFVEVKVKK